MDTDARGFPLGDMRVSDADRDRALSELSEAFQAGRITSEEFGQRSGQVLAARTGKELAVLLADLPISRPLADLPISRPLADLPISLPAAATVAPRQAARLPVPRIVIGASVAAACLAAVSVTNAASQGPTAQQREIAQEIFARQGLSITIPPNPPFDWAATLVPGAIAVLLVVLIFVFLRVTRAGRA
ncbi:MAG: DUF1707 SHOCT-like domain-containing protein [Streptosporangiaceae bacterium]